MSTSVVVVSHWAHQWLAPCLESALAQADEVILVDNGSPGAESSAIARRLGARVERLPANTGFAGGVNAGLRVARSDLVALLNDDATAEDGWLLSAAGVLADPAVAAVGPKVLFARCYAEVRLDEAPHFVPGDPRPLGRRVRRVTVGDTEVSLAGLMGPGLHGLEEGIENGQLCQWRWSSGSGAVYVPLPDNSAGTGLRIGSEPVDVVRTMHLVNNAGSYLSAHGHGGDYGLAAPDDGRFDTPAERFGATGAALVARSETFRRLGGLAEPFFAYYEDTDWCWRARLAGLSVRYEPSGIVRHIGGVTTGGPAAARVRFLAARNRLHTLARNAPLPAVWSQLRSPVDRPPVGMTVPLARRVSRGLVERRFLSRRWVRTPMEVWSTWAGRDERW